MKQSALARAMRLTETTYQPVFAVRTSGEATMQREALAPRPSLAALLTDAALSEARLAFAQALGQENPDHFFLELSALTWFPFAHDNTLVAALGFDARDPRFLERHRERIVRLLAHA